MTIPAEPSGPMVFVSYANDASGRAKQFALRLHSDLRNIYKINAVVADRDNPTGASINEFCIEMAWKSDWTICVCTPEYVRKSRHGSTRRLAPEFAAIMEKDVGLETKTLLPVLLEGDSTKSIPLAIRGRVAKDFRDEALYGEKLAELVSNILPDQPKLSLPDKAAGGGTKLVLVADVDGFSEMTNPNQQHIMSQLWPVLMDLHGEKRAWEDAFPILDGFGIIWADLTAHREVIETAEQIVGKVLTIEGKRALRCGLHQGAVFGGKLADGRPHFFGTGINDAGRACGLGDAGNVILTNAFWLEAKRQGHWPEIGEVWPKPNNLDGVVVFPMRGDSGKVRVLHGSESSIPSRLELRRRAQESFQTLVGNVGLEFADALKELHRAKIDIEKLRVTFWMPAEQAANELWFSAVRVQGNLGGTDKDGDANSYDRWRTVPCQDKSSISYSTKGEGEGPPGMAWVSGREGKAVVAHNLPAVTLGDSRSEMEYDAVLEREFNLAPSKSKEFSRRSTLIGACAFPLPHVKGMDSLGVICIDMDVKLPKKATRPALEELLVEVMQRYSTDLSLAWKFRT